MEQNLNRNYHGENFSLWELKRSSSINVGLINIKPALDPEEKSKRGHFIICRLCSAAITLPKNIIEVNGKHRHTFTNPAGNVFTIGCFSIADGCMSYGEPTAEYTWFSGFNWCYALCSACYSHLGWHYESIDNGFYGLILDKLIENI